MGVSDFTYTITPNVQTKIGERVCASFDMHCPSNSYFKRFLGYTIDWGDGTTQPYDFALAVKKYQDCLSEKGNACGKDPSLYDNYKNKTPQSSATQCHTYKALSEQTVKFSPWLISINEGGPAAYAWQYATYSKTIYTTPYGYCAHPKG